MKSLSLSARAAQIPPSPTLGITARANAMRAEGQDVVSLAAGEPDFPTPTLICDAAIEALRTGATRYTPTPGTMALRRAVVDKMERENRIKVAPEQVIVSSGAKQSLFNACTALLDPGDEVVLFAPYWMTYAEQIRLAGATPRVVRTAADQGFVPDPEQVREAIGPRTKAVIVNSPSNPTGAVFPRALLKEIAALALRHDLWVISDEIYERLVYGVEHTSIASLGTEIADRTITITGCSKSFAMTGWRIGFAAAPLPVAKAMSNFQDQVTSCANAFAQAGAVEALRLGDEVVGAMRDRYQSRRDLILGLLREAGLPTATPSGAFYVMPDASAFLGGRLGDDAQLAEYLLEEAKVATIPGCVFEGEGHLRLSYATSEENIEKGVGRIASALDALRA